MSLILKMKGMCKKILAMHCNDDIARVTLMHSKLKGQRLLALPTIS